MTCVTPDIPLTALEQDILSDLLTAAALLDGGDAPVVAMTHSQRSRGVRRRSVKPSLLAAGVAIVITGGAITAAAAGVLPDPWAGPGSLNSPFVTASDPTTVTGATVELAVPGPESVTFEIVTDRFTRAGSPGECTALVVKGPQGRSEHLGTGCGQVATVLPDGQTQSGAASPLAGFDDWQSRSDTSYTVVSGSSPAGANRAVLTDPGGNTLATGPASDGKYLVYLPAQDLPSHTVLTFYSPSRQLIDSQNLDDPNADGAAPTPAGQ
jgi:hypothetical protein